MKGNTEKMIYKGTTKKNDMEGITKMMVWRELQKI